MGQRLSLFFAGDRYECYRIRQTHLKTGTYTDKTDKIYYFLTFLLWVGQRGGSAMAAKGVFCLEGLWQTDLRKASTVQPILGFLKQNAGIPYIYRDCATQEEFKF